MFNCCAVIDDFEFWKKDLRLILFITNQRNISSVE